LLIQKYWQKLIGWISRKLKWITSIGSKIKNFFGFGSDKEETKKLNIKHVTDKVKPIVAATAIGTTVATAQPIALQQALSPIKSQYIQSPAVSTKQNTAPSQPDIIYNFNFGDIKVETKDGKIANPEHLKEEIQKVIEEINFDKHQRSLSDVM
jgi:hypothetical protein